MTRCTRFACAVSCLCATEPCPARAQQDGEVFNVWAVGDCHAPADIKQGRESLALPIRQAAGLVGGAPAFDWDVMIDAGDLSASQFPPLAHEGREIVRQYRALTKHYREDVYQVAGNHDGDYYDKGPGTWFSTWIDPLGEHADTSEVHADRRRFPVEGTWERYRFQAGNILFLMLSDYNSAPAPVGRGSSKEERKGGHPAGAIRRETFEWWKQQVLDNRDKIIVTMHHHVLRDTTTRSKFGGGRGFHGASGGVDGSGYLFFLIENADPEKFEHKADAHVFEDFLAEFEAANGRPAIDLWIGGHSHAMHPEQVHQGQGLTATRWGVTFIQCSGLTRFHGGGTPVSRLLTFTSSNREVLARLYVHDRASPQADAPRAFRDLPKGWYAPAEHKVPLRVPFVAPPPDPRPPPPAYSYTPVGEDRNLKPVKPSGRGGEEAVAEGRTIGPPTTPPVVPDDDPLVLAAHPVWQQIADNTGACVLDGCMQMSFGPVDMADWPGMTVSAWIKTAKTGGQMRVVSKDNIGVKGNFVLLFDRDRWTFRVFDRQAKDWASASWQDTSPNDGQWHHIAGVAAVESATVVLYVDGKKRATAAWTGGTLDDSRKTDLVIGSASDRGDVRQAFTGSIAAPLLFRCPLDAAAVQGLARAWAP